jgi:hypothetical protein
VAGITGAADRVNFSVRSGRSISFTLGWAMLNVTPSSTGSGALSLLLEATNAGIST